MRGELGDEISESPYSFPLLFGIPASGCQLPGLGSSVFSKSWMAAYYPACPHLADSRHLRFDCQDTP